MAVPPSLTPVSRDEALALHQYLCVELARTRGEQFDMQAVELRQRSELFQRLNDGSRNITQVREEVNAAAMPLAIQQIQLDGDIATYEGDLRWLELLIAHRPNAEDWPA
jgi:hypothetical protein